MRHHDDEPMYRTFEEFEREELRRADTTVSSVVEDMFDEMFTEELTFATPKSRRTTRPIDDADDEE